MKVGYAVDGSGPGLLLVHGTGANAETTWGDVIGRFTDRHSVIRPNLDGSDKAPHDERELTVEGLAEQVHATIDDVGQGPVDLVGFSLGAVIAAAAAAVRPELVRRLVLVAGWSRTDQYVLNLMTVWRSLAGDPDAFGRFAAVTAYSPAYLNELSTEDIEELAAVVRPTAGTLRQIDLNRRVDIRGLLPAIKANTLVIGCARDNTIPVQNARGLAMGISGSSYAELDCGHVALVERTDEVVRLIQDFTPRE